MEGSTTNDVKWSVYEKEEASIPRKSSSRRRCALYRLGAGHQVQVAASLSVDHWLLSRWAKSSEEEGADVSYWYGKRTALEEEN